MLRMELNTENWATVVNNSLIGAIIFIGEQDRPIRRQSGRINSKPMVLSSNKAPISSRMSTGLIVTSVSIPIIISLSNIILFLL